jgi:hypothetical protein
MRTPLPACGVQTWHCPMLRIANRVARLTRLRRIYQHFVDITSKSSSAVSWMPMFAAGLVFTLALKSIDWPSHDLGKIFLWRRTRRRGRAVCLPQVRRNMLT